MGDGGAMDERFGGSDRLLARRIGPIAAGFSFYNICAVQCWWRGREGGRKKIPGRAVVLRLCLRSAWWLLVNFWRGTAQKEKTFGGGGRRRPDWRGQVSSATTVSISGVFDICAQVLVFSSVKIDSRKNTAFAHYIYTRMLIVVYVPRCRQTLI